MKSMWKLWKIISNVAVTLVVVLAVVLVGLRLLGFRAYTVLSGSMEPAIPTGALIYVRSVPPEKLEPGDVITFLLDADTAATHRIVEVLQEKNDIRFVTKGDANDANDGAPVHSKNVVGIPVLVVPGIGYAVRHIQSPPGTYLAVSVGAVLMLALILPDLLRENESPKRTGKYLRNRN